MSHRLPHQLVALIDRTLNAARLAQRDHVSVRAELECHLLDALDAGTSPADVLALFGDPVRTAELIRRAKRRGGHDIRSVFAIATSVVAVAFACYTIALIRMNSAPDQRGTTSLEREAATVTNLVSRAESRLDTREGIRDAYAVTSGLMGRGTLWAELASIILLDRLVAAADSLGLGSADSWLSDSLRAVRHRRSLAPNIPLVRATVPLLVAAVYGYDGHMDRGSLRLIQRTKGVASPTWRAVLLEPFYFSRPLSREDVQRMIERIVDARVARADAAGRRLLYHVN